MRCNRTGTPRLQRNSRAPRRRSRSRRRVGWPRRRCVAVVDSARCCRPPAGASCHQKDAPRSAGGAIQTGGLNPERRHPRDAACGPRIAESDARFGGAVVTPIWGSCGMALSATAGAPAGRSAASGCGCLHRAPVQLAGGRGRRGGRPGSKFVPDARAAALGRAQGGNDAACERAKHQDYAAMVYARSRSPSYLTAGDAARRGEGRPINKVRFSTIYY